MSDAVVVLPGLLACVGELLAERDRLPSPSRVDATIRMLQQRHSCCNWTSGLGSRSEPGLL
jgi:hypothetical protein